ncbi:queuosine 5'-phosphate N-glycosylase/hydrolase-like isoform X2 [Apostichopus japonicus]|uniref:queuosine 5'-phosphate N-glycosylase/hydrolase-like isoform X2 n=1 Tax=Stichopus japonicus TaxID=307972 RepID=UPI003AB21226
MFISMLMSLNGTDKLPLPIRESSQFNAENCDEVTINEAAVDVLAEKLFNSFKKQEYSIQEWKHHKLHPQKMVQETVDWIFIMDTLNFSFWSESNDKRYLVEFNGEKHSGYWALCAAIKRAVEEGIPITDPSYYAKITEEQLKQVFRSATNTPIPLLEQRRKNLHEAGKVLLEKFGGSFVNCILECDKSAQKLLDLIVTNFPSYRDVGTYKGKRVSILKRAQILIADIWACFEAKSFGEFHDIDSLTMFADYRVPQVLNYFGILEYSDVLMKALREDEISNGDPLELEIRGCSIWAVELILKAVRKKAQTNGGKALANVNSVVVDFYLWDYSKDHWQDMKHIPIHRLRSTYY